MTEDIIRGVISISNALKRILDYEQQDEAHVLCAKATINGALAYAASEQLYRPGSVPARRAEGLFIEQALRTTADALRAGSDPRLLGAQLASRARIEELVRADNAGSGSLLLEPLTNYLATYQPEYRSGLLSFGEQLETVIDQQERFVTPVDVALGRLDARRIDPRVRRIFREFNKIVQLVNEQR